MADSKPMKPHVLVGVPSYDGQISTALSAALSDEMLHADVVPLVNTGLLLVDLRQSWVEQAYFTIHDAVWQQEDGKFVCDVEPEDWFFSARAAELGARVFATRKVAVEHRGIKGYSNQGAWGTLEHA